MAEILLPALLDLRQQFLGFIQRRVRDRAIAEDILQAAYLRALETSGRLRQHESATGWFYRILRNAIIDNYRRRATEGAALERWARELEHELEQEHKTETTLNSALRQTTCACIANAIRTLAPSYASFLREVDLGEATLAAYASVHRITAGNAAVRAHRARAALRKKLIACCGTCATHGCLDCTCSHPLSS